MKSTPEQRKKAAQAISEGQTDGAVAAVAGVSRRTICSWKKQPDFIEMVASEKKNLATCAVSEYGQGLLDKVRSLERREPEAQEALWEDFLGVRELLQGAVANTAAEELGPRAIPALASTCISLLEAYVVMADRVSGLGVMGDAIIKMGIEISPATAEQTSAKAIEGTSAANG